jgi:hypothetical protein
MRVKRLVFVFAAMSLAAVNVYSQSMTIDRAISTTAAEIGRRLAGDSRYAVNTIAVLNFSSQWQNLSTYVVNEMIGALNRESVLAVANEANGAAGRAGVLATVGRQQMEAARRDLRFQVTDDVNVEFAQRTGRYLGAQSVMIGRLTVSGNSYRFISEIIDVQTGETRYNNPLSISRDSVLNALMDGGSGGSDFGKRLGYGFLNPLFGLGSYIQGDGVAGGLPLSIAYAASGILIIVELAVYDYWDEGAGVCGTVGLGIAGAALIYGFVKPFFFSHGNRYAQAAEGFRLGIVPAANNGFGLSVGYAFKF